MFAAFSSKKGEVKCFDSLEFSITRITTQGSDTVRKFGKPCKKQLCFKHDTQLAVVDTLYKFRNIKNQSTNETDDINVNYDKTNGEQNLVVTLDQSLAEQISK